MKAKLTVFLFIAFSAWWAVLQFTRIEGSIMPDIFAASYGFIALLGGIWGLSIGKRWGGFRSTMGRAISVLSLGLLAQEFGQLAYAYYAVIKHIEIPYPSIGDVGYFGSVILYIYGILLFAKAAGVKFSLRSPYSKLIAVLVPGAILAGSYVYFLKGYEFDWSNPIRVMLDFGYPLGQAFYISLALLTYLLSRKVLGGIMRNKIFFVLIAFVVQYAADYNFLYQVLKETWNTAAYGDYLYLISYVVMTLALLQLGKIYNEIKESQPTAGERK